MYGSLLPGIVGFWHRLELRPARPLTLKTVFSMTCGFFTRHGLAR